MKTQRHLVPLAEEQQDLLREALTDRGEEEVSELLGVSRIALLRGAAGLGVMRGTRALIVRGLEAVLEEGVDDDDDDESDTDREDADAEELDEHDDEDGEDDDDEDEDEDDPD